APVADANPHTYQRALLAGGLFACCVQLQFEVVGSYRLAADMYSAASRRPAEHIQFATRCAAYWVGVTQWRNPDARTAAGTLWRECLHRGGRFRGLGGVPAAFDAQIPRALGGGFSSQGRSRPPMRRAERRRFERELTVGPAPTSAE